MEPTFESEERPPIGTRPPTWDEAGPALRQQFPDADPDQLERRFDQHRELELRRRKLAQPDNPVAAVGKEVSGFAADVMPFARTALSYFDRSDYHQARQRFDSGQPKGSDYQTIADYEQRQQEQAQRGPVSRVAHGVASGAGFLGEALAGGAALQGVKVPLWAGGQVAALTALTPRAYAEHWMDNNEKQGRDPLHPAGLPAAYGLGLLQNAVFLGLHPLAGALTPAAMLKPGAAAFAGRSAIAAGSGLAAGEVGQDVASGLADLIPALSDMQTGYGSIGAWRRGEKGKAAEEAVTNLLTFSLFHMVHEGFHGTPEQIRQRELPQAFVRGLAEGRKQDKSLSSVLAGYEEVNQRLGKALEQNPDLTRAEAQALMDDLPEGTQRQYGQALAGGFPEAKLNDVQSNLGPSELGRPPEINSTRSHNGKHEYSADGGLRWYASKNEALDQEAQRRARLAQEPANAPPGPAAPPTPAAAPQGQAEAAPTQPVKPSAVDAMTFSDLKGIAQGLGIPVGGLNRAGILQKLQKAAGKPEVLEQMAQQILNPPPAPEPQKAAEPAAEKPVAQEVPPVPGSGVVERTPEKEQALAELKDAERAREEARNRILEQSGAKPGPSQEAAPPPEAPAEPARAAEAKTSPAETSAEDSRDEQIYRALRSGLSTRTVGKLFGISHEKARQIGNAKHQQRAAAEETLAQGMAARETQAAAGKAEPQKFARRTGESAEVMTAQQERDAVRAALEASELTDREIQERLDDESFHNQIAQEYNDARKQALRSGHAAARIEEVIREGENAGAGGPPAPAEGAETSRPARSWRDYLKERIKGFGKEDAGSQDIDWILGLPKATVKVWRELTERAGPGEPIPVGRLRDGIKAAGLSHGNIEKKIRGKTVAQVDQEYPGPSVAERLARGAARLVAGKGALDKPPLSSEDLATPSRPQEQPASLQRLQERFDAGEDVTLAEVYSAAGLSAKEQHLLQERLADRTLDDIAQDGPMAREGKMLKIYGPGAPSRESLRQMEEKALQKLGIFESLAKTVHEAGRQDQLLGAVERGKGDLALTQDMQELKPLGKRGSRRLEKGQWLDEQMEVLANKYIKEKEQAGGKLSAEREAHYQTESARLDRQIQEHVARAERKAQGVSGQGAGETFWSDESGTLRINLDKIEEVWDDIKKTFSPASRGAEAGKGAGVLRQGLAHLQRETDIATKALEAGRRHFEQWIEREPDPVKKQNKFLYFTDAIELGRINVLPPELRPIAKGIRDLIDQRTQSLLHEGLLQGYIENYLGHLWQKPNSNLTPEQIGAMLAARKPLAGAESFRKQRSIPTYREGIENHGLEPISWNPVELALQNLRQMDKSLMGRKAAEELKGEGLMDFVRLGQQAPAGWVRMNDRMGTVFAPRKPGGAGPELVGHWYLPEPVSRLMDNYLQPGLRGHSIYDAVRGFGNVQNLFQLGFSGFHGVFTALDTMISSVALGNQYLSRGQVGKGLAKYAEAPIAPLTRFLSGRKMGKEWLSPGSQSPEVAEMVQRLEEAGGRHTMDSFYKSNSIESLRKAVADVRAGQLGRSGSALVHALPALAELFSKPLMEVWVPAVKKGVFADLARYELEKLGPQANDVSARRQALGKAWDSVENRLGQLTYDNVFWNRTLKDVLMASVRSVGWNLGDIRELGGAIKDLPASARGLAQGKGITSRLAYGMALPMVTGLFGAVYQFLATGKGPEELKDLFFPKTGRLRKDGVPDRLSPPSYMKDVAALVNRADEGPLRIGQNAGEMAKGKLHPTLTTLYDALSNQDFFGKAIRDPRDPLTRQSLDTAQYLLSSFESISSRSIREQLKQGASPLQASAGMVGLTPAPSRIVHTWEQQRQAEDKRKIQTTPLQKLRREKK